MNGKWKKVCLLLGATFLFLYIVYPSVSKAELADGTYTIDYTVMHGSDPSASIANDYWEKPATLTVENGEMTTQLTLNNSSWIVEYQSQANGRFSNVTVVLENTGADTRVVKFPIDGISEMTEAQIHVIVPDIEYDHDYTVRLDFHENTLTALETATAEETEQVDEIKEDEEPLGAAQSSSDNDSKSEQGNKAEREDNPQTNDGAPIALLLSLVIVSAIVLLRRRVKQA
ncbi:heme uptake protein IsdC [Shouchella sp. JSM 1781072]|uniref:heme uptake protein IsdC n=1 Tax=Shouchella sp. JSM 1781072 TaxID=3344581 RepID=UPI0035BFCEF2